MYTDDRGMLQGTLELLVLKTLSWGPAHGYAIAQWIEDATDDALRVEEGSLYPTLHRMLRKRWVEASWGASENNRRARYYKLTPAGRAHFTAKARGWHELVDTIGKALAAPRRPRLAADA